MLWQAGKIQAEIIKYQKEGRKFFGLGFEFSSLKFRHYLLIIFCSLFFGLSLNGFLKMTLKKVSDCC
jgi:hypothetical protein